MAAEFATYTRLHYQQKITNVMHVSTDDLNVKAYQVVIKR